MTWKGRMMVAIITMKRPLRPGNWNRLKPYATQIAEATAPIVDNAAIANVLKNRRGNAIWSHASWKLSKFRWNVQCFSSVRDRPSHSIGPAATYEPGLPLHEVERRHILRTLQKVGGNRTEAARLLQISVRGLQYKLKQYLADSNPPREASL